MTVGTAAAAARPAAPTRGRRRGRTVDHIAPTRHGANVSSAPAQTAPPVYPDKIDGAVLKIAGVVVLGAIMSILDITVVSVALPTFQTEFGEPGARPTPPSPGR